MSAVSGFDSARETLAGLLDGWVFGKVRSVKTPDAEKTYFHGILDTPKGRVWFQQSKQARRAFKLGPMTLPETMEIPKIGDVVMGRVDGAVRKNGKNAPLLDWYTNAGCVRALAKVCFNGTQKVEFQLLGDMRNDSNDDAWALCRLVMFGNVRAFADMHTAGKNTGMRLSVPALDFVHAAAELLCDPSIWDAFLALVPGASPPSKMEPPSPPPRAVSEFDPPPFQLPPPSSSLYCPPYAYCPTYCPTSPPRLPASPPYCPTSPPRLPASPPYCPTSPPRLPASPPYCPNTPPPASPPYCPNTPPPVCPPVPQMNIETLSKMISQYCPPVSVDPTTYTETSVAAYDPYNPTYTE